MLCIDAGQEWECNLRRAEATNLKLKYEPTVFTFFIPYKYVVKIQTKPTPGKPNTRKTCT